jgi:hypothetical protein
MGVLPAQSKWFYAYKAQTHTDETPAISDQNESSGVFHPVVCIVDA